MIDLIERTAAFFTGRPIETKRIMIDSRRHSYLEINVSEEANRPLLIGIHGLGANETQMKTLVGVTLDQPYTYLALRAFHKHPTGGYAWFPFELTEGGFSVKEEVLATAVDQIDRFIEAAIDRYQADPNKVVFVGYSQGGALAFSYLLRHPERVTAVVATAGTLIEQSKNWLKPEQMAGQKLFIGYGTLDPFITPEDMIHAEQYFTQLGVNVSYHEYRIPHVVSDNEVRDISAWLQTNLENH